MDDLINYLFLLPLVGFPDCPNVSEKEHSGLSQQEL